MKKIAKLLFGLLRPLTLVMLASFVLAPVVYYFGHKVVLRGIVPFGSPSVRLWTAIALLALGSGLVLFRLGRAIVTRMRRRAAQRRPRTEEEIEATAMAAVVSRVARVIRNRWARGGRGIYGLPWYLVLGRPGAGKTSLIDNADLRFPVDHEIRAELADLGDSRAAGLINWRVAGNEAVLIDLNGEQLTTGARTNRVDAVLWSSFLKGLVRIRPRRPLNGVVLVVDMMEFAEMAQTERASHAADVRRSISDLVESLATRLTVTIVFTKIDQLAGFLDYFADMTAQEREELFGFHFLFEGRHTPDWPAQFDSQFKAFLDGMHRQVTQRLSTIRNPRTRREAFAFCRTLAGLHAALAAFLEGALSPDKFSTAPLVRGVYFVSVRQENAPRSVFLEAVGQTYDLPEPLYGTSQGASHPYFVTRLFKTAIFPEAGLAGKNIRAEMRYRNRALATSFAALTAVAAGWLYWAGEYRSNLATAENVLALTTTFATLDRTAPDDLSGGQLLAPLNAIQEATLEFASFRDIGAVPARLSLYQGRTIGPIADAAYHSIVNDQFAPTLVRGVAERLSSVCPKGSDDELELLRVYRMLGDADGRDDRVLKTYFHDLWQTRFEADAVTQSRLQDHLDYMLSIDPQSYSVDENLIRAAQNNLSALSPYQRVYGSLRALAERQLPNAVDFRTIIGANFPILYDTPPGPAETATDAIPASEACAPSADESLGPDPLMIARFFTRDGFLDFFVPQNVQVARVSAGDLWVLGQMEDTNYSEEDYARIQTNMRALYADDYVRTWRRALNALQPRPFADIRDATEALKVVSGPNNPLRTLAVLVAENAEIYDPGTEILSGSEMAQSALPFDPDKAAALEIHAALDAIARLTRPPQEGEKSNMDQIEEALAALHEYLKSVRDAPDPNALALELAIKRAELKGEDPIFVLNRIAERTPAPFDAHLRHIASESWRVIMIGATEELNRKWHDEIYGDFQRLIAGRYPFRRTSELDLPVEDFIEFFGPDGILETFYKTELLIFVDEATGKPRIIDGQSLAVDADFAERLGQAIAITRSFFNDAGDLSVEFSITTQAMSANIARAVINFEGQVVASSHGPSQPITIVWPNVLDGPRASRIDIAPLAGNARPVSRQFDGVWSWLRLYDSAAKSNLANNSVDITFGNANGQGVTFRLRPEARVNPFFNSPLNDFDLPSHLRTAGN